VACVVVNLLRMAAAGFNSEIKQAREGEERVVRKGMFKEKRDLIELFLELRGGMDMSG
jgi:hypothetical protein